MKYLKLYENFTRSGYDSKFLKVLEIEEEYDKKL